MKMALEILDGNEEVHIFMKLESLVLLLETTNHYHKQEIFVIQNPFDIFIKFIYLFIYLSIYSHKTLCLKCSHRQLL
jgi:hypothetical protein